MERTVEKTTHFATSCKSCGMTLTNPGYNKQSVMCCGKYRRWYNTVDVTTVFDDGRDEKGRFHHRAKTLSRNSEIRIEGGN